jgi:NADPH-dependent F420 reductase
MIGFVGGTGPDGMGLALRFAMAGNPVLIGSRNARRAQDAADSVTALADGLRVAGALNEEVCIESDVVFVTVPYAGHQPTLESNRYRLQEKIVVDVVVPLEFGRGGARAIEVPEGSAAQQAQAILPESKVVGAFHNVSADELLKPAARVDSDVIVCSDDAEAKSQIMRLAEVIDGVRAVDGDGLHNSRYVEQFTAMLININRIYKTHSTIKIVGI